MIMAMGIPAAFHLQQQSQRLEQLAQLCPLCARRVSGRSAGHLLRSLAQALRAAAACNRLLHHVPACALEVTLHVLDLD